MPGALNPFDDQPSRLRAKVAVTFGAVIGANVLVWAWAVATCGARPALLGTAVLAYAFGLRHAFDADHIAAIDNVVRNLMRGGKRPFSVGFFFSLGHSTVVVLAALAIAAAAAAFKGPLERIHAVGGMIGTVVSAAFLLAVGVANLFVLKGVWVSFDRVRRGGDVLEEELDLSVGGGLLARLVSPAYGMVSRSWQMYPVGFLFGLGFDTATEIGLLGISAAQAVQGTPIWTILVFAALFTAGMSLLDLTDSLLMTGVYGWAFIKPVRKLWYNLTITAASVVVAIFIGGVEATGLIAGKLRLQGEFWRAAGRLGDNLGGLGFGVVGIFLAAWAVSAILYRVKGYDALQTE